MLCITRGFFNFNFIRNNSGMAHFSYCFNSVYLQCFIFKKWEFRWGLWAAKIDQISIMSSSLLDPDWCFWLAKGLLFLDMLFIVCGRFCRKNLRVTITIPTTNAITKSVNVKNESKARLAPIQRINETLFQKVILFGVCPPIWWNIMFYGI